MSEKLTILERYDHLGSEELEARLLQEEKGLLECSPADQLHLLHELRVYQIELEMQNRELRDMQSELEISRDRYASLYDHPPIAYLTLDKNGIIQQVNLAGAKLFGQQPVQIISYPFRRYLDNAHSTRFFRYLRQVFSSPGKPLVEEFQLVTANGELRDVSLHSIQVQEADTQTLACRTAIVDLTQLHHAQAEAQMSREALAHASRLGKLGEMASGLVHEISQPMSAIITYSDILRHFLQQGVTQDELLDLVNKLETQAKRSVNLITQLRDFSRSRPMNKMPHSLSDIIEDTLQLIKPELKRKSELRFIVGNLQDLPLVHVDPLQISQVLINLFSNALEAIREQGTRGFIRINAQADRSGYVQVSLLDNGPGVSADIADQLFLPFTSTKPDGLGIGLSLSHSIIEAHGGRMWLNTETSDGAEFLFTLPIHQHERPQDE